MLKDLKQFVVGSNVAEVGVGLSVGAAFTALVAAVVDFAKDGIKGEWAYAGITAAGIALVTVIAVSMVGVVKPLMKLRAKAAGNEAAVEEAEPVAAGSEATVDEVAAGEVVEAVEAVEAVHAVEAQASSGAAFAADPLHAPIPFQVSRSAVLSGPASVVLGAPVAAAPATAVTAVPAVEVPVEDAPAEAAVVDLTAPSAPAAPVVPAGAVPFRATELTACPHCAFDVPATATRCGWCTSDLTAVVAPATA